MPVETPPRTVNPSPLNTDSAARSSEVDLASGWRAVARLWWLVLLCGVLAVAVALLDAGRSPQRFESNATVYVGQPIAPNGALLNTVSAKATTAIEIASGEQSLDEAARAAGRATTPAEIRSGLSVTSVQSPIASKLLNPPTMLKVTVRHEDARVAKAASGAIAQHIVDETNTFSRSKTSALEQRAKVYQTSVDELSAMRETVVARASGGDAAVWTALLATISSDLRLTQAELLDAQSQLQVAREIEVSRIVAEPGSRKVTVATRRPTIVVALFAGLAIGAVLAIVIAALRNRSARAGA